jgi:hypothetical protein
VRARRVNLVAALRLDSLAVPDKIVPGLTPSGWAMPQDFQERAAKCDEWAQKAGNANARTAWADMAQHWRGRAEDSKRRSGLARDKAAANQSR